MFNIFHLSYLFLDDISKLAVEVVFLLYYVIGLSIMSSVIVSIGAVIEDKTKKLDDPMEAIRNLRIENLNSKAMKKLGYKMDDGYNFPEVSGNGAIPGQRRGTIVPVDGGLNRPVPPSGPAVFSKLNLNRIKQVCGKNSNNNNISNNNHLHNNQNIPNQDNYNYNYNNNT